MNVPEQGSSSDELANAGAVRSHGNLNQEWRLSAWVLI